jgi:molecular chaperone DnaJ
VEKDYFQILQLPPTANAIAIKKAYRKMALQYHPDRIGDSAAARLRFNEITEAYQILNNPSTREAYIYERYFTKNILLQRSKIPLSEITIEFIDNQLNRIVDSIKNSDEYRLNKVSVFLAIKFQITEYNSLIINESEAYLTKLSIFNKVITACKCLSLTQAKKIAQILITHYPNQPKLMDAIKQMLLQKKLLLWWDRLKLPLALLLTTLACWWMIKR